MKGDFSRLTFDKEKHFSSVLMQQGRVQVDADWNEQQAIGQHRVETEALDAIGPCGAPEEASGFQIAIEEGKLRIGKGRYYVDGILCENERDVSYEDQPDLIKPPDFKKPLNKTSMGLVYLDVWQRHITVLEDSHIREKALGGPDTATRAKTVWQVRVEPIETKMSGAQESKLLELLAERKEKQARLQEIQLKGDPKEIAAILTALKKISMTMDELLGGTGCPSPFVEWDRIVAPSTGTLNARTQVSSDPVNPCDIPPSAGYRRLENQLYRVEIHREGSLNVPGQTKKATFKWSRENGSVVTAWTGQSGPHQEILTVTSTGRDDVLGFAGGQWVELTDDKHDLDGTPGTLVRLVRSEGQTLTIDPATVIPSGAPVERSHFQHNPKVRRWDTPDGETPVAVPLTNDGWLQLEDGIEIKFGNGTYHPGDYWLIPARTAVSPDTGNIEWPVDGAKQPLAQLPQGIRHHYCRLALVYLDAKGNLYVLTDCRRVFSPLTGWVSLYYVGGDGQEAMPDPGQPQSLLPLAKPLQVGVARGRWPVTGATVLFEIKQGVGRLQGIGGAVKVATGTDGVAACNWSLDATTPDQEVEATLLDTDAEAMQVPVRFHANLSVASQVAYDPKACPDLQARGVKNVQQAIDELCGKTVSGGGCAYSVGVGGHFGTLKEAFSVLQSARDIWLCLMPGNHSIDEDLDVNDKNCLKIAGCGEGSVIRQNSRKLSLAANQLVLQDLGVRVSNDQGAITLMGSQITAERCAFIRTVGSQGIGPLVLIRPSGTAAVTLRWKNNRMAASWVESVSANVGDFLVPAADIALEPAARERLSHLSKLDPYADKEAYSQAVSMVSEDIVGLSRKLCTSWFKSRPVEKIEKLPPQTKEAVKNFYTALNRDKVNAKQVSAAIDAISKTAYVFHTTEALALAGGVGGWVEDNVIQGIVALRYASGKTNYLGWAKTDDKQRINKQTWADKNQYLVLDHVDLTLMGNDVTSIYSNGYSIMQVMDSILDHGSWPHNLPEQAYRSVTVSKNMFWTNRNSFVCQSLIMDGNQFNGVTADGDIAAFVLGYAGVFAGNLAPIQTGVIEKFLKSGWMKEVANFLGIV